MSRQKVGFSSPREEVEGASRCLQELMTANVPIKEFVSDQHVGVKKLVGKNITVACFPRNTIYNTILLVYITLFNYSILIIFQ